MVKPKKGIKCIGCKEGICLGTKINILFSGRRHCEQKKVLNQQKIFMINYLPLNFNKFLSQWLYDLQCTKKINKYNQRQMDKKKLSAKEIFRTLAFHYHYDQKIPLQVICDMVSSVYYPKDPTGESRKRYKNLLVNLMKQHTNSEKHITEQQFIDFMNIMNKNKKEQYTKKLARRIFNRYLEIDKDTGEQVICEEGFKRMAVLFKIHEDDALQYFHTVADRKNQINYDKFYEYMNAMVPSE